MNAWFWVFQSHFNCIQTRCVPMTVPRLHPENFQKWKPFLCVAWIFRFRWRPPRLNWELLPPLEIMWQKKCCYVLPKWIVEKTLFFIHVLVVQWVFCTAGANRGTRSVLLPLFSHLNCIFNFGCKHRAMPDYFFMCKSEGLTLWKSTSRIPTADVSVARQGFLTSAVRKHFVKHSVVPLMTVFPLFLILGA